MGDRLTVLFTAGRGNHGESRADLFSAVTEFYTHEATGNSVNKLRQFTSSEFGTGADRNREFFKLVQNDEDLVAAEARGAKVLAIK